MLPCLQCKLPPVFTTNKDQLGWRTKHITFSLGLWATKTTPILRPHPWSWVVIHYKHQAAMR